MKLKIEKEFELTELKGPFVRQFPAKTQTEYYLSVRETTTGRKIGVILVLGKVSIEVLNHDREVVVEPYSVEGRIARLFIEQIRKDATISYGVGSGNQADTALTHLETAGCTFLKPTAIEAIDNLIRKHLLIYPQG